MIYKMESELYRPSCQSSLLMQSNKGEKEGQKEEECQKEKKCFWSNMLIRVRL